MASFIDKREGFPYPNDVKKLFFLLSLLPFFVLFGCATSGINKGDLNIFSYSQEARLGKTFAMQIANQMPILSDPELTDYVDRLGHKILSHVEEPVFEYQFRVVKNDQINAFALPGGFIYVNLGLLHEVSDESELAGVLAHEISHIICRHGTETVTKAQGFSLITSAAIQILGIGTVGQELVNLFGNTGFLYYGRTNEYEADKWGAIFLHRANYDVKGMVRFFEKLKKLEGRDPIWLEELMSTHPKTKKRIKEIEKVMAKLPSQAQPMVASDEFKKMKERITRYPRRRPEKTVKKGDQKEEKEKEEKEEPEKPEEEKEKPGEKEQEEKAG